MKTLINKVALLMIAAALVMPLETSAQTSRSSRSTSSTSQDRSSSSSSRSSATVSNSSSSSSRNSGTTATRSSSTSSSSRSSATAATSSSGSRTSSYSRGATTTSQDNKSQATRSSGTTSSRSSSATTTGNTGSNATRSSGTTSTRSSATTTRSRSSNTAVNGGTTTSRSSATTSRNTGYTTSTNAATTSRSTGTATRSSGTAVRTSTQSTNKNTTASKGTVTQTRSTQAVSNNVRTNDMNTPRAGYPGYEQNGNNYQHFDAVQYKNRIPEHHGPGWERPMMMRDYRPIAPYHHGPHYFGYRLDVLPRGYSVVRYHGIDYFYHDNIYYRRYGGHYIISRPPVGVYYSTSLFDLALTAIVINRMYNAAERAREAAIISAQYAAINRNYRVRTAEEIANTVAYNDTQYYYDDGVFYTMRGGNYHVIEAPVGALVTELPYDYEEIVLNGQTYYMVDNVLYKIVVFDGALYFQVMCQL